ncbi:MarR family winged helix-turn-helix transcriptional regulator [Glycomyces arizonensis]|uniref:MarR family winged helix-turn-helix transcriptional regulator n=1 Tax=Glycomyces arizonensis TaxID=256035 RepID=UPI00041C0654|nr:MarR family transcriptional regulator [Glycomyces arizonensis]
MNGDDGLDDLELAFKLGLAFQLLISEFTARGAEAGYGDLRPVHGLAFQALGAEGATSSELAQRLGVTKQAAGQIVDYLERHGYVERRPHPEGGRRKLVVLTSTALVHLRVAGRILQSLEAELGDRIGAAELGDLHAILGDLIRALTDGGPLPPLRPVW